MRRLMVLGFVVVLGMGCAAATRWEKAGGSQAERQRDEADCTSRASEAQSVPAAQGAGTMTGTPTASERTQIRTYDPDLFAECMRARGYQPVTSRPGA